jgi:hypothetical protein
MLLIVQRSPRLVVRAADSASGLATAAEHHRDRGGHVDTLRESSACHLREINSLPVGCLAIHGQLLWQAVQQRCLTCTHALHCHLALLMSIMRAGPTL